MHFKDNENSVFDIQNETPSLCLGRMPTTMSTPYISPGLYKIILHHSMFRFDIDMTGVVLKLRVAS